LQAPAGIFFDFGFSLLLLTLAPQLAVGQELDPASSSPTVGVDINFERRISCVS